MLGSLLNLAVDVTLSPVRAAVDIFDGMTVGELRVEAAFHLGVDVAAGMGTVELLEYLRN